MNWEGIKVYDREGTTFGIASGHTKDCTMESCKGERVMVRWPDHTRTWPCSQGLKQYQDGWRIM